MRQDPQERALRSIDSAATAVRACSGSDANRAACTMLDALIESYTFDLMQVKPDALVRLQAAILQSQAIRRVLADESADSPRI